MLTDYIKAALHHARYEILGDDGVITVKFPNAMAFMPIQTLQSCRRELREVLEEWILFRLHHNLSLPIIDGIDMIFKKVA